VRLCQRLLLRPISAELVLGRITHRAARGASLLPARCGRCDTVLPPAVERTIWGACTLVLLRTVHWCQARGAGSALASFSVPQLSSAV